MFLFGINVNSSGLSFLDLYGFVIRYLMRFLGCVFTLNFVFCWIVCVLLYLVCEIRSTDMVVGWFTRVCGFALFVDGILAGLFIG